IERMKNVAYLWEPRGAWPDDVLIDVCRELDLVHTVDPFLRDSVTPEFTYWRLHGIGSAYRAYTDEELQSLAARVAHENTWVMFNNIPRVADATRFMALTR
ncbi:MAG TPA: DUF72 domain-containing protein, partial [Thermoanaerobaculia bacterium]|nr:DUF72 domain-containing protein [Thermoanaerobaculia bacterium]